MQPEGMWEKMHGVWAFCSAVIAFPFPLTLPCKEVFGSDAGATAAEGVVGLLGGGLFGKVDFNNSSMDCTLMSSLSSSKRSCNLAQRKSKSRSGD